MRFRAGADGLTVTTPSGEVISYPPGSVVEGVLSRESPTAEAPSSRKMRREREDKMLRSWRDYSDKSAG